jgi:hypothetical protein
MTSERLSPKRRSGPQAREVKAAAQAIELAPIMVEIRASGAIKLQAIADELNARGIPTARGGKPVFKFAIKCKSEDARHGRLRRGSQQPPRSRRPNDDPRRSDLR